MHESLREIGRKFFSLQFGKWQALQMGQRVTLYLLGDRSLFVAACACGGKGEGIEGREVCRQLFVLVGQPEPNIEGAAKPLFAGAFKFTVQPHFAGADRRSDKRQSALIGLAVVRRDPVRTQQGREPFGSVSLLFGSVFLPFGSVFLPFGSVPLPFGLFGACGNGFARGVLPA